MENKKGKGLSVYIVFLIIANLVLAFIVGRSYLSEKKSGSFLGDIKNEVGNTVKADTRSDRPDISEFNKWFYVVDRKVPAGVDYNVSRTDTFGSWKATIYITGKTTKDDRILLLNVDIDGEGDDVEVVMDWFKSTAVGTSGTSDETSKKDTVLKGSWVQGSICVSDGNIELNIPSFYRNKGKEYGTGTGKIDGLDFTIGLVRDAK